VEVRDLSSFPNYKNKTLPSKSPKMKNSRLLLGEGMFQGQSFLHSSNCYVILYKYGPTMKNHLVYYWQGEMTSSDVRAACALQAFRIEHELSNHGRRSTEGVLIRVEQGREPSHFVRMFGGTLIIVRGGKKFMLDESKQKLYQVMQVGRNEDQFRVEQMEADSTELNSDYVFILVSITVELTWIWKGKGARQVEISEAERMAKLMYPYSVTSIEEGKEPIAFWTVLGGQDPYARSHGKPRLFSVTTGSNGRIEAMEVFDYTQTDLSDRRVAVLDNGAKIFIWVGQRSKKADKGKAKALAEIYLETDPTRNVREKERTPIVIVDRDSEPKDFKQVFPSWNEGIWSRYYG